MKVVDKGDLQLSGVPWIPKGERRRIGISSIVGKCLCRAHNSDLHALDTAAVGFFEAIKKCDLTREGLGFEYLFSGHDIERWMLKTAAALGATKNLAREGVPLPGVFSNRINLPEMLEGPGGWRGHDGIYFLQTGTEVERSDEFRLTPLSNKETGEIMILDVSVQGLRFDLAAMGLQTVPEELRRAIFRPACFHFVHRQTRHSIFLSWEDRVEHQDVTLTSSRRLELTADEAKSG